MTENQHVQALSEEALMSVAYGEETLTESESEHLKQCAFCQQKATQYRRANALLRARFYRFQCPSSVELNYYCLGTLSGENRKRVDTHILDCLSCADEVVEIRQSQANFEAFPTPISAFSAPQTMRRLVATYVVYQPVPYLSQEGTALTLRNQVSKKGWPRRYQADLIDISLHLSRKLNDDLMLIGIIASSTPGATIDDFQGSKVYLYYASSSPAVDNPDGEIASPLLSTEIEEGGNFTLVPVPIGNFLIHIYLPEQEIIIGEFTVN